MTAEAAGEATAPGAGMRRVDQRSGAALAAALTASAGATTKSFPGTTMVSARAAAQGLASPKRSDACNLSSVYPQHVAAKCQRLLLSAAQMRHVQLGFRELDYTLSEGRGFAVVGIE